MIGTHCQNGWLGSRVSLEKLILNLNCLSRIKRTPLPKDFASFVFQSKRSLKTLVLDQVVCQDFKPSSTLKASAFPNLEFLSISDCDPLIFKFFFRIKCSKLTSLSLRISPSNSKDFTDLNSQKQIFNLVEKYRTRLIELRITLNIRYENLFKIDEYLLLSNLQRLTIGDWSCGKLFARLRYPSLTFLSLDHPFPKEEWIQAATLAFKRKAPLLRDVVTQPLQPKSDTRPTR